MAKLEHIKNSLEFHIQQCPVFFSLDFALFSRYNICKKWHTCTLVEHETEEMLYLEKGNKI